MTQAAAASISILIGASFLMNVFFKEGQEVKRGETLFKVDSRPSADTERTHSPSKLTPKSSLVFHVVIR